MDTIDIYIDFACPFSNIGGNKFLNFLDSEGLPEEKVHFRSFLLNPNKTNDEPNFLKNMSYRFGLDGDEAATKARYANIINASAEIGSILDVDHIIDTNSKNAHVGLQFATKFGKQVPYFKRAMAAHWERGEDYSDINLIASIIKEIGLDSNEFMASLPELNDLVDEDFRGAIARGVSSVPTFYRGKILLQGSGSYADFKKLVK